MQFSRDKGELPQQFVPGKKHKLIPTNTADAQVEEAMRISKEMNAKPEVGLAERIAKMDAMNPATAFDFLDGLSQFDKERYLMAERMGKARRQILGRYGW